MSYSDWQLNRIRDALFTYYMYQSGNEDSGDFTWKDVSEAVEDETGVHIPHEQLRKFAVGTQKDGGREYNGLGPPRLEAVVSFVTDEDNYLLSQGELNQFMPSHQAAFRLLEYLDQDIDLERMLPPAKLKGLYRLEAVIDDEFVVRNLTLAQPLDTGLIQVVEIEDCYESEAASLWHQLTPQDRMRVRNSQQKYGGWAILSPEDNLFFFLKNELDGTNRYYFTMTVDVSFLTDAPQTRLVLLHHHFPLELEDQNTDQSNTMETIKKNMERHITYFEKLK